MKNTPQGTRIAVLKVGGRLIMLTATVIVGSQVLGLATSSPLSAAEFDAGVLLGLALIAAGDYFGLS